MEKKTNLTIPVTLQLRVDFKRFAEDTGSDMCKLLRDYMQAKIQDGVRLHGPGEVGRKAKK